MRATCPDCGATGHVSAFFADDDGKRLLAAVVELPSELQRPAIGYLSLFKPPKNSLSAARATRVVLDLQQLVATGTVCLDDRGGVRRNATPTLWARAIEQMLQQRESLTLPLPSHAYLRKVVFTLADQVEAKAEREIEQQRKSGQHRVAGNPAKREQTQREKYENHAAWLRQQLSLGGMTRDEFDLAMTEARVRHGIATHEKNP
ncbi:MAG: hypothetical protein JNM58_00695 [Xanthomonadaceae bacterium]|nr:hypothetical protein [Xanthomonadaceae bacterium]